MRNLNRRDFLKWSATGASLAFFSHLFPGASLLRMANAASSETLADTLAADHFFILISTAGGMDATLGLDPQLLQPGMDSSDLFVEYAPADILSASGLRLGPAAQPLIPHSEGCAIINGIMMRKDAGHDALRLYMASGSMSGRSASLPVELSAHAPPSSYGVLFNSGTQTGARSPILSSLDAVKNTASLESVQELLRASQASSGGGENAWSRAEQSTLSSKDITQKLLATLGDMKKGSGDVTDAQVLGAAFSAGAAQFAEYQIDAFALDTHANHEKTHLAAQKDVWQKVADLFATFKKIPFGGASLFEHTTFMVISEFSRTPALNPAKGKDHNPFTNSVLLAGKNVRGGALVGASKIISRKATASGESVHIGAPFNLKEGNVTESHEGASFIYPENVAKTVAEIFGVATDFESVDDAVLPLAGAIRKT